LITCNNVFLFQVQLNRDRMDCSDGDDVSSESGEVGLSLLCVTRRISHNEKSVGTPIEQFSMKLDTSGKIIGIDTFGVSAAYSQYLNKVGTYDRLRFLDEKVLVLEPFPY